MNLMNIELENKIITTLRTIYDPEIPVDIYDLGLIYKIDIDQNKVVNITMTLTNPGCPVIDSLLNEVHDKIKEIEEVSDCNVNLVFDPAWNPDMMSDAAKLDLDML